MILVCRGAMVAFTRINGQSCTIANLTPHLPRIAPTLTDHCHAIERINAGAIHINWWLRPPIVHDRWINNVNATIAPLHGIVMGNVMAIPGNVITMPYQWFWSVGARWSHLLESMANHIQFPTSRLIYLESRPHCPALLLHCPALSYHVAWTGIRDYSAWLFFRFNNKTSDF